ncbi:MAG: FAD-dependent oxidoreductase [Candidatus Korarchaeota archaeon]
MNEDLCKRIMNAIERELGSTNINISIRCEGGIVYIRGDTNTWDEVVKIGKIAASFEEVIDVVNDAWPRTLPKKERKVVLKEPAEWDGIESDVVIIGAGIVGCTIARELSQYDLRVIVVEKENDVGWGSTKGNAGWVHAFAGLSADPSALKSRLCVEGSKLFPKIARELGIPYIQRPLLALVFDEELLEVIDIMKEVAEAHGIEVKILRSREEVKKIEPNAPDNVLAGILFPTYATTFPVEAAIAIAENAAANGVKFIFDTEVIGFEIENNIIKAVVTNRGKINTKYVINAAGVYADDIAELAGVRTFTIHPRKGVMIVVDESIWKYNTNPIIASLHGDEETKGGGILLVPRGNVVIGPNAKEVPYKDDLSVDLEDVQEVLAKFSPIIGRIPQDAILTQYAGIRAATYKEDFVIGPTRVKGFINAAGMQSPGLTAAPAVAKMIAQILKKEGLELKERGNFSPTRRVPLRPPPESLKDWPNFDGVPPVVSSMSPEEIDGLIKMRPEFGEVICRCQKVTVGEVVEAVRRGARTLDGLKYRVGTQSGRCQGGFCTPRLILLLSQILGVPPHTITKKENVSYLVLYEAGR